MRGGKRPGAGRREKADPFRDAFRIWAFIEDEMAEKGIYKNAIKDAMKKFGKNRSSIYRQLELVNNVFVGLAIAKLYVPDSFDRAYANLVEQGWFNE